MIKRLAHVRLKARDLAKCEAFYCGVLGLRKKFDFLKEGRVFGFYLEVADRQYIEVFETEDEPQKDPGWIRHYCLEVDDIQAHAAHLRAHGVECSEPVLAADHAWQCWCKDPDGVDIEFHQYTEASCQLTGAPCLR